VTLKSEPWSWREGEVDESDDHFELRYGTVDDRGWDDWLPVAIVGPAQNRAFAIHFLIDCADASKKKIVEDLVRELNYYFVELNEEDPWRYLQYHAGTSSNVYSSIHWSFFPKSLHGD